MKIFSFQYWSQYTTTTQSGDYEDSVSPRALKRDTQQHALFSCGVMASRGLPADLLAEKKI